MASKQVRSGAPFTRALPRPATVITSDHCISLSGKVCDLVDDLSGLSNAYIAVERLISPEYADEAQAGVPPSRAELGALLNTLNTEMLRKINALADNTTVLQAQLTIDAAQTR